MTNDELDNARADEAWNIIKRTENQDVARIAARLAREGWTPPVAVDPDEETASALWDEYNKEEIDGLDDLVLEAIKRGRALAAAEAKPGVGYQDWPRPDEINAIIAAWENNGSEDPGNLNYLVSDAILYGQKRAAPEAKPGMVWVKHNWSGECPVYKGEWVWIKEQVIVLILQAQYVNWRTVTHYAIITPPEDVA